MKRFGNSCYWILRVVVGLGLAIIPAKSQGPHETIVTIPHVPLPFHGPTNSLRTNPHQNMNLIIALERRLGLMKDPAFEGMTRLGNITILLPGERESHLPIAVLQVSLFFNNHDADILPPRSPHRYVVTKSFLRPSVHSHFRPGANIDFSPLFDEHVDLVHPSHWLLDRELGERISEAFSGLSWLQREQPFDRRFGPQKNLRLNREDVDVDVEENVEETGVGSGFGGDSILVVASDSVEPGDQLSDRRSAFAIPACPHGESPNRSALHLIGELFALKVEDGESDYTSVESHLEELERQLNRFMEDPPARWYEKEQVRLNQFIDGQVGESEMTHRPFVARYFRKGVWVDKSGNDLAERYLEDFERPSVLGEK